VIGRCECEKVLHEKANLDRFQGRAAGQAGLQGGTELGHTVATLVHFQLKGWLYLAISGRRRGEGGSDSPAPGEGMNR